MKTIVIAASKGGSTKTTVTTVLAAQASTESNAVAMIDLNADQGSLSTWWTIRGEPSNPVLLTDVSDLPADIQYLRDNKIEWLLIDTPPLNMNLIEAAVMEADAVVIPVRPSLLDVAAIGEVVEMCMARKVPYAFLLSAVDAKMPKLADQAIAAIAQDGPILSSRLSYRQNYITAFTLGKTGGEVDEVLASEAAALWAEIKALIERQNGNRGALRRNGGPRKW